jgi:formate-dependent phosphoribosylglycinamide formyltransferase (GAR transformylase)
MLLGAGELGKEVVIEAQRFGAGHAGCASLSRD